MSELDEADVLARASKSASRTVPGAEVGELSRLHGGVSSLTFAATLRAPGHEDTRIALKVAPPGLAPIRNRDVLRQARIIRLLDGVPAIRVPSVLFEDDGAPPLFGMRLIPGESYEPLLDVSEDPPTPGVVDSRARAAGRMLAHIQALDPVGLGVADEPITPVGEELDRWAKLFATVDPDICPGHERLHRRLARQVPESWSRPTLVHGDYRLANMLFVGESLEAVIDWEIWGVGDPRTDLAWLLMHTDPVHSFTEVRNQANQEAGSGVPSLNDLLAEYQAIHAIDVADLEWFLAYCHYKTAATIAVLAKRNRKQPDPDPALVVGARSLDGVLERGHEILSAWEQGERW